MSDNNYTSNASILNLPQLIPEIGRYLYGPYGWQKRLAADLWRPGADRAGTDLSTMLKWVRGERPVPGWVAGELLRLVRESRARKVVEASRLERVLAQEG